MPLFFPTRFARDIAFTVAVVLCTLHSAGAALSWETVASPLPVGTSSSSPMITIASDGTPILVVHLRVANDYRARAYQAVAGASGALQWNALPEPLEGLEGDTTCILPFIDASADALGLVIETSSKVFSVLRYPLGGTAWETLSANVTMVGCNDMEISDAYRRHDGSIFAVFDGAAHGVWSSCAEQVFVSSFSPTIAEWSLVGEPMQLGTPGSGRYLRVIATDDNSVLVAHAEYDSQTISVSRWNGTGWDELGTFALRVLSSCRPHQIGDLAIDAEGTIFFTAADEVDYNANRVLLTVRKLRKEALSAGEWETVGSHNITTRSCPLHKLETAVESSGALNVLAVHEALLSPSNYWSMVLFKVDPQSGQWNAVGGDIASASGVSATGFAYRQLLALDGTAPYASFDNDDDTNPLAYVRRFELGVAAGVSPARVRNAGAVNVTISGRFMCSGATDLRSVSLCDVEAEIVSATADQIVVVAGPSPQRAPLVGAVQVVSTEHGNATLSDAFTYDAADAEDAAVRPSKTLAWAIAVLLLGAVLALI